MSVKVRPEFAASQFAATQWSSADDKALFLEKLARFVEAGYPEQRFTKALYRELNLHMFGHIAEFDQHGFYGVWFSTKARQHGWVENALSANPLGDPKWSWCDAELVFQKWLVEYVSNQPGETISQTRAVFIATTDPTMAAELKAAWTETFDESWALDQCLHQYASLCEAVVNRYGYTVA